MKRGMIRLLAFALLATNAHSIGAEAAAIEGVRLLTDDAERCRIGFNVAGLSLQEVNQDDAVVSRWTLPGAGMTFEAGMPALPLVSRWVVVPPTAGLELNAQADEPRIERGIQPPALVQQEGLGSVEWGDGGDERYYPPLFAEMSAPVVRRGVRMVKVTTYPVQYDRLTGDYLVRDRINAEVRFTDDAPENPALYPVRRNRSRNFLRHIREVALNGNRVGRDDPDYNEPPKYVGHYLIVTHANCLQYAAPFIEWRRKGGYRVDILNLSDNDARNANTIQQRIQQRYNAFLERGEDPFEYILLIGDRDTHFYPPASQWVLTSHQGTTRWGANHADYLFACLEGNDQHLDVGVSRWPSGSIDRMELAVGRTLAYEANPHMQNTEWFGRGGVYSQHWGNGEQTAWHISLHSDARWAEEVLKAKGFRDITFYERFDWDQMGNVVGPVIRDMLNNGTNLMLGRAENYYFVPGRGNHDFNQEVRANVVFPIEINTNGHGEWSREIMFRTGAGNNLKGYAATSFTWNGPPTAPNSAIWMEMVRNFVNLDQPYGWAYSNAVTDFELYFPNASFQGQQIYPLMKTEVNNFADPGMLWWRGVPQVVRASFPEEIALGTRFVEAQVTDPDGEAVSGASVCLYFPGAMPAFNNANYADYNGMVSYNAVSDSEGWVRFHLGDEFADVPAGTGFLTVTGRDIKPFFGQIAVRRNLASVQVSDWSLEQVQGNGDDHVNPGEVFRLRLTARNLAAEGAVQNVRAAVRPLSAWIVVDGEEISFGNINAGAAANADRPVTVTFHRACPDGNSRPSQRPSVEVEFRSGESVWRSSVTFDPRAPNVNVRRVIGNGIIPTEMTNLNLEIINSGRMDSPPLTSLLSPIEFGIGVVRETAVFPAVRAGASVQIAGDPFVVAGNRVAVPGSKVQMRLALATEAGFADTAYFDLQVGQPRERTPLGPDAYGYICFDDLDQEWEMAPDYDWVEISQRENDRDFDGVSCQFTGNSPYNIGESRVVELGFETQFYGQIYDRITIGTNGFIAMGSQPRITNFQNWPMDRAIGGGMGMIAPLWDDLALTQNGQVYYYHDRQANRFIVEWYKLRARDGGQRDQIFQVILLDRQHWGTASGDQNITFQYKQVENVPGRREGEDREKNNYYASVGISSPDGATGISYSWMNQYPVQAAPLADRRALIFATSAEYRTCILYGRVTDAATGEPIPEARIITNHGFVGTADEDGYYRIGNALAELEFSLTASAPGYNDSTRAGLEVPEGDSLEVNFGLLHPEFSPSVERLFARLDPDRRTELPFQLNNTGNGTLNWSVERRLLGDANAAPWEFRRSYNIGEQVNDDRVEAVVFINDRFYIAVANNGRPVIYVMNRDGALLDTFPQPREDSRGIRDLAWDGRLLWGGIGRTIYGFTLEGQVETSFESPYNVNPITSMTYDPRDEILWYSSTTTDIFAVGRDGRGHNNRTLSRRELRIYGLTYWSEDPNGHRLYVFHRDRESNEQMLHKFNTQTGDTIRVATLRPPRGGSPGGAFITNQFDVYSWVFIGISSVSRNDGGDRVDVWQLDARKDWFRLDILRNEQRQEAQSGTLTAGERADFILTLDAADLPIVPFDGELRYYHNANGFLNNLPVRLEVIGQVPPDPFDLALPADGDSLDTSVVQFAWTPAIDPNFFDEVFYSLWLKLGEDSLLFASPDTSLTLDLDTLGFDLAMPSEFVWYVNALSGPHIVASNQRYRFRYLPSDLPDDKAASPLEFGLRSAHPNPFNATLKVSYGLDRWGWMRLSVHDMTGRRVATLWEGARGAGLYNSVWQAASVPSGVYLVKLEHAGRWRQTKVVLVK